MPRKPFWQRKKLDEMTSREWESLCDGCGRCCLHKYEDSRAKKVKYTDVACKLLNTSSCRCKDYANRSTVVPSCKTLTRKTLPAWLPKTCAYRLVNEGKPLFDWHPLVSGRKSSVKEAGISVSGLVVSEVGLTEPQIAQRLVTWPMSTKAKSIRSSES